jgi:hypothetical protein
MSEKNCGTCRNSEGIDGTNRIGCNIDKKQHDIDYKCLCYEGDYVFDLRTGFPILRKDVNA